MKQTDHSALQQKLRDFHHMTPHDFFQKYSDEKLAFILAAPKQKAIGRVFDSAMTNLKGRIFIKPANKRDSSRYAIDLETGIVFGIARMKPGGLVNAFHLSANEHAPPGTRYIKKEIDKAPAPFVAVIGRDTFHGLNHTTESKIANTYIAEELNTSHAGLYLGAKTKQALENIGTMPMKIAVTDRYEPLLREYLNKRKQATDAGTFIMPELIPCDGRTEDYIDAYSNIDVFCDIIDGGTSALNAHIEYAQLLDRSNAVVIKSSLLK